MAWKINGIEISETSKVNGVTWVTGKKLNGIQLNICTPMRLKDLRRVCSQIQVS